jgi:hypothetical protein
MNDSFRAARFSRQCSRIALRFGLLARGARPQTANNVVKHALYAAEPRTCASDRSGSLTEGEGASGFPGPILASLYTYTAHASRKRERIERINFA